VPKSSARSAPNSEGNADIHQPPAACVAYSLAMFARQGCDSAFGFG
jgi:hypothetical protein